jgi:hypothetical protein
MVKARWMISLVRIVSEIGHGISYSKNLKKVPSTYTPLNLACTYMWQVVMWSFLLVPEQEDSN